MRAFISTGGRRRYKGTGSIMAGITPQRTTAELAPMALREARRIVAETEPWREGGKDNKAWPPRWYMLGSRLKDDLAARNARLALVGALRAFVGEE